MNVNYHHHHYQQQQQHPHYFGNMNHETVHIYLTKTSHCNPKHTQKKPSSYSNVRVWIVFSTYKSCNCLHLEDSYVAQNVVAGTVGLAFRYDPTTKNCVIKEKTLTLLL